MDVLVKAAMGSVENERRLSQEPENIPRKFKGDAQGHMSMEPKFGELSKNKM